MEWTNQAPTVPGNYWRRLCSKHAACAPDMVEVVLIEAGGRYRGFKQSGVSGTLMTTALVLLNEKPSSISDDCWWEWAGPIPHPTPRAEGMW